MDPAEKGRIAERRVGMGEASERIEEEHFRQYERSEAGPLPQGTKEWSEDLPGDVHLPDEKPPRAEGLAVTAARHGDQRTVPAPGSMEHRVTMLEAKLERLSESNGQDIRNLFNRTRGLVVPPLDAVARFSIVGQQLEVAQRELESVKGRELVLTRDLRTASDIDEMMVDAMREVRSKLIDWVLAHPTAREADACVVKIDAALRNRDVARHKDEL